MAETPNPLTAPLHTINAHDSLEDLHRRVDGVIARGSSADDAHEALRHDSERLAADCRQSLARRREMLTGQEAIGDPSLHTYSLSLESRRLSALAIRRSLPRYTMQSPTVVRDSTPR
jgi:hypothetical protein